MMGNRGLLHDDNGVIRRPWQVRRWLTCVLEFKGRHRQVMAPDRYTELFFLDERTALAAGHRPCFECRRKSYNAFVDAWTVGNEIDVTNGRPTATSIDDRLHEERVGPGRSKRIFVANIDDLPDGVFVTSGEDMDGAYLIWDGHVPAWSPGEYKQRLPRPAGEEVNVLTPRSTVAAIRAGCKPGVHPTATELAASGEAPFSAPSSHAISRRADSPGP
jgi:hypothetical protein